MGRALLFHRCWACCVVGVVLLSGARGEESAQPGVAALIDALAPLSDDPAKAQAALKDLDAERQAAEASLSELNTTLENIRKQIAEAEAKKAALEKRLKAVDAGCRLVETAFAPATPVPVPAPPATPATTQAAAPTPAPSPAPAADATPAVAPAGDPAFALFNDSVHPIFEARCLNCHDASAHKGGLDLSTRAAILKGGESGPMIVPGDPEKSLLIKLIRHEAEPYMPHKADKMPEGEIAKLVEWVKLGAGIPADLTAPKERKAFEVRAEDREFWSFRPLAAVAPPPVKDSGWAKNPVDQFVLAKLEEKGLTPAPEADRRTLIRRAYYDLAGLPPTPEEVEAFVNDAAPDAWEKVVDHLLASPHYGERWGRHWLDLARYADSDGYEFDKERPTAFPYRDFVIKALNEDMPFDQFVRWQLAGDEYAPENQDALAATGFLSAGPIIDNQVLEQNRYDELDDILSTTCSTFLAMNVGCARCHDHKYDPIPTKDYYRFLSAFTTTARKEAFLAPREEVEKFQVAMGAWDAGLKLKRGALDAYIGEKRAPLREAKVRALGIPEGDQALLLAKVNPEDARQKQLLDAHGATINVSDDEVRKSLTSEQVAQWDALARSVQETERQKPMSPPSVYAMTDAQHAPKESFLLARGNVGSKKEAVSLGFLSVLPGEGDAAFDATLLQPEKAPTTYRRTAVAEWIVNMDKGAGRLSARVLANRLWHYHFGAGIVRTPNDFGRQGDRPTHPELLDWLAGELVRGGWHLKPMHKLLMMSSAYRMGTEFNEASAKADPENHLWWRRRPQRVEAEILRDAVLTVSGCLNTRMYGPGIYPAVPEDAIKTGSTPKWPLAVVDGPETWRRSVYIAIRRSARFPFFEAFDMPDTVASAGKRLATVTPTQGLELMNSPFVNEQARHFAQRIAADAWRSRPEMVRRAYALALCRPPSDAELEKGLRFLEQQTARYPAPKDQTGAIIPGEDPFQKALVDYCQVVLSLNEFAYVQ